MTKIQTQYAKMVDEMKHEKSFWKESDLTHSTSAQEQWRQWSAPTSAGLQPRQPQATGYRPPSVATVCQLIANIFILIQYKVQGLSISNLQFSNFDSSSSQIQFESYSLLNVGLQSLEITAAVQRGIGDNKDGMVIDL